MAMARLAIVLEIWLLVAEDVIEWFAGYVANTECRIEICRDNANNE